nr:uncharacterized protein LOC129271338 [Lytechinus pictus]
MGFGLCNAPATFQRVMNLVLRGLTWDVALAFLDDILVLGKSFPDHIKNLGAVLRRFKDYRLKLKPKKCALFQRKVEFLGREVDATGLHLPEENIQRVVDWPTPASTKEVEQFLGLANYHRVFMKDYARVAGPLYELTGNHAFSWTEFHQEAFEQIKALLTSAPVLTLPNAHDPFILDTDASSTAIGAELLQVQNGEEKVIAYGSLSLSPQQRNYCVTRRELLALVLFCRQYRHYLLGRPFTVRTDHGSLTWLLNFKTPTGQLSRWLEELGQYNMKIEHRPGRRHSNADSLSRIPDTESVCEGYEHGVRLQDLPCGGCSYCTKRHKEWAHFVDCVDDVVPLSQSQRVSNVAVEETFPVTHMEILFNKANSFEIRSISVDPTEVAEEPPSDNLVKQEQEKNQVLVPLREWLTNKKELVEGTLFLLPPEGKFLWTNRELFYFKEGVIWMKKDVGDVIVIPESLRHDIIRLNHDPPSAGHAGINRTRAKLKSKYYWYRMSEDIRIYIARCATCNQNKKATRPGRHPMKSFHASAPMERVHLDFMGPLPKTTNGNENILVMVDQFTKWVECVPLPSQTAEMTAHAAVSSFFCRFGYPFQIFTDQGRNFESTLFKDMCRVLDIHKSKTTAFRPQANSQVERANRTVMDAVRCYVSKSQRDWDRHLQQIAGAIRSSVNRTTGFTPNKLMLGREVNLPSDLVFSVPQPAQEQTKEEYVAELTCAMRNAHISARAAIKSAQRKMKRDYDIKQYTREFEVNDRVYIRDTACAKGKSRKLNPPWKGPAIIVEKRSPYLYRVAFRKTIATYNHDRLKKCTDQSKAVIETPGKDKLYCFCRKPDDGSLMICCDECNEWYHGACVGITETEGLENVKWFCPPCTKRR